MRLKNVAAAASILVLLGGVILIRMPQVFEVKKNIPLLNPPRVINNKPAGEIIDGFVIEQEIQGSEFLPFEENDLCIHLYLANYNDRQNAGNMDVVIARGTEVLSGSVVYGKINDNAFEKVCFDNGFHQPNHGNLILTIRGVGGKPGSSITAWLTEETRLGRAVINGNEANASLVLGLTYEHQRPERLAMVLVLTLLFVCISATLMSLASSKR
jgi:hypothetical protein